MVKENEMPMKYVKARASTINKRREIEAVSLQNEENSNEETLINRDEDTSMTRLYGEVFRCSSR